MSDKVMQTATGRIFKQPVTSEKSIRVEIVSNIYERDRDGKATTRPCYTTILLTGGLMSLWAPRLAELTPGAKVSVHGDWSFSLFTKRDGSAGLSCQIFPFIFEVSPPRQQNGETTATAASTSATTPPAQEDDLPF